MMRQTGNDGVGADSFNPFQSDLVTIACYHGQKRSRCRYWVSQSRMQNAERRMQIVEY